MLNTVVVIHNGDDSLCARRYHDVIIVASQGNMSENGQKYTLATILVARGAKTVGKLASSNNLSYYY
jgi:uncharacterized protein YceH (UPF0502 family)